MKRAAIAAFALSWAAMAASHILGYRMVREVVREWELDSELSIRHTDTIIDPDLGGAA